MKQKPYVIDKVPYDKLGVESRCDYGKIWYCHMRGYPEICVGGSIGTRQETQKVCNLKNQFCI